MQVVGSDKFKFFPICFGNVVIPFGDILAIKSGKSGERDYVEILTVSGNTHYPNDISFDRAVEIYIQAFKDCEY